jgi:chaperonin GroEL (HSP60 family)
MNAVGDVYGQGAAHFVSCFGPCGRSKVLHAKVSGSLAVTRDTRHLFGAHSTSPAVGSLERLFASITREFSAKTGDGEMSAALVLSTLVITSHSSITTVRSEAEEVAIRARNLQAIQHILHSSARLQETITAFLTEAKICGLLHRVGDMRWYFTYTIVDMSPKL